MTYRIDSRTVRIVFACAGALALEVARADAVLEERISVEGAGLMSMGNMSITTTSTYARDRALLESDFQVKSKLVRAFARGIGPTTEIVRLDQDTVYELDTRKKRYTQTNLSERRAQIQEAMRQSSQAQQHAMPMPIDESQCEWSPPRAEVKRTGEKATLAGHEAERLVVIATQSCKSRTTGHVCDVALTLDQWLAPRFTASDDVLTFQRAYAEKLGFTAAMSLDASQRAESMFSRYQGIWKQIATQTRDARGYPVRSSFVLAIGGPQCQGASGANTASPGQPGASGEGMAAGRGAGLAGALFRRKKQDEPPPAAQVPPPTVPSGMAPVLTMTSELLSVATSASAPGRFEVPADFKPVARK